MSAVSRSGRARITVNGRTVSLGSFAREEDAATDEHAWRGKSQVQIGGSYPSEGPTKLLERSLEETSKYTLQLGDEQRQQLLVLGNDLERVWDHPACPVQLKKRILRTVIKEVVVGATADPPRVILKLHWAGGTHTELVVRKNQTGHHEHVSSGEVIDLIRELSQVCEDGAIVAILNRLGYRTGVANTWNEKRV